MPAPMPHRARAVAALVLAAVAGASATARADGGGDGVYGRLDGDVVLAAGAGGGYRTGPEAGAVGELQLRASYLGTAGLLVAPSVGPTARLLLAVDFRPLFPALFLQNLFTGSEWLDLLVQSVGLELGAAVDRLDEPDGRGVGLAVGFGVDVPLVLPSMWGHGVFLRLGARHVRAPAADQVAPSGGAADWTLCAVLTVPALVDLGLAEHEPPRFRSDMR